MPRCQQGIALLQAAASLRRVAHPFIRISVAPTLAREDNAERVRKYRGPLLVLGGSLDDKAAPAMSRALAEVSATPDAGP